MFAAALTKSVAIAIACIISTPTAIGGALHQAHQLDRPMPDAVHVVTPHVVTFNAVGDSLTSWEGLMVTGEPRVDTSWTTAVSPTVHLEGGWARGGAGLNDMEPSIAGLELTADVFVLLGGTNNIRPDKDNARLHQYYERMGAAAAQRGQCVVLVAVPPFDNYPDLATDLSQGASHIASAHGWSFVDPWIPWREEGRWAPGASPDGIHPSRAVADAVGLTLSTAIAACERR